MSSINRREFLKGSVGIAAGVASLAGAQQNGADMDRPNLVFVFPDEYRKQAMGFLGEDPVITPNLDRFAAESLVLTDAISNAPVCSPFRGMLMTGKYPWASGVPTNCNSSPRAAEAYLRADERCLSDVLSDAGYNLGYIGKWHLDKPHEPYVEPPRGGDGFVWDEFTPPERRHGFDFWHSYGCFDGHMRPHYWTNDTPREEPLQVRLWSPVHEADVAVDYIANADGEQRDPEKPFALFVSMNPPHMPFHLVPRRYQDMYAGKTSEDLLTRPNVDLTIEGSMTARARNSVRDYFAMVTGVDVQFGRILSAIEAAGLKENTIVIFTSDHGEMMGSHDRMHKSVWYEESMGIPFIIRWPERIKPGTDDLLLSVPDVMPTLLELMGAGDMTPADIHGTSHARALLGEDVDRPASAPYIINQPGGLRTHRYTFVKLAYRSGATETILHDNERDPYQMENVADAYPGVVAELTNELNDWLERCDAPWRM